MIQKIDHIGIAVKDLEKDTKFYRDVLGLSFEGYEDLPDRGIRIAVFNINDVRLELIQSISPDSAIATFIERRGEGLHHIALGVDDAAEMLAGLVRNGVRAIDSEPRKGAGGSRIAFLDPRDTGHVLLEIYEKSRDGHKRK